MGDKTLNHHSAAVIPFFERSKEDLVLVFEQKDGAFRPPYFDNGLNGAGGNCEFGVNSDLSPEETVVREVNEEFWERYEAPESLNGLLGQEFLLREPEIMAKYNSDNVKRIKDAIPIFIDNFRHAGDFVMAVPPPIVKAMVTYGSTVFTKQLSQAEFGELEKLLQEFDGKLTTDNLKWGSRIVAVSLRDINLKNMKFSWGYCQVVNELLRAGRLPEQPYGVLRPLELVKAGKLDYPADVERSSSGAPTYAGLRKAGFEYFEKKK